MARTSRRARVRQQRDSRRAVIYLLIAGLIIAVMLVWGVPLMARLAGMLITDDTGVGGVEDLKPTPPVFSDVPEATSSASVSVRGFAQPGVEVVLVMDGAEYDRVLTDDSGIFEFDGIILSEGENNISSYAVNSRGGESESSKAYSIRVDRTPPELRVTAPESGRVFRGTEERVVEIRGEVSEEGVKVYVGERIAIVSTEETFEQSYQLQEGDQEVVVKAVDVAGNETSESLSLRWEP